MRDDPKIAEARREALALLDSLHVCTLATCGDEGPHAVFLFYAHSGFDLFWFSDPAATHSRHVDGTAGTRVAVTIAADCDHFADVRGLQIRGPVKRLGGPMDIAAALARLTGRFGFLSQFFQSPGKLADAMQKAAIYHLAADSITYIDNSKGFGHKTTFPPDESGSRPI